MTASYDAAPGQGWQYICGRRLVVAVHRDRTCATWRRALYYRGSGKRLAVEVPDTAKGQIGQISESAPCMSIGSKPRRPSSAAAGPPIALTLVAARRCQSLRARAGSTVGKHTRRSGETGRQLPRPNAKAHSGSAGVSRDERRYPVNSSFRLSTTAIRPSMGRLR